MVENYCPHLGGQVDSTPHSRDLVVEIIEFFALTQPILKVCRMAKGNLLPATPVVLPGLVTFLLQCRECRERCLGNDVSGTTGWGKAYIGAGAFARLVSSLTLSVGQPYFTPFGYTRILLASPVFKRSMATAKSFIGRRSVITGRRSSRPLVSSAVI